MIFSELKEAGFTYCTVNLTVLSKQQNGSYPVTTRFGHKKSLDSVPQLTLIS